MMTGHYIVILTYRKQLWVQSIAYYMQLTKSKDTLICFSDKNNFRKELDSSYKSYRKKY
jgi:hypothetical protein